MAGAERHVWERTDPWWHAGVALFVLLTAGLLAMGGELAGPPGILLGVIAAGHAVLGPAALRRVPGSRIGLAHLAVVVPATVALFVLTPIGSVLLFVAFPMLWRLLPSRAAVVASVVLVLAVAADPLLTADRVDTPQMLALFGGAALTAVLLGLWITGITEQSARRAELLTELERTRTELAAAHRAAGALAERERFARDVHDTLAQGFTSLTLLVRAAGEELDRNPVLARRHLCLAEETARENLAETRALVAAGTPAALVGDPLPVALTRLADGCGRALGGTATVDAGEWRPDPAPPADLEVAVLRLAQEALSNVRRHSGARTVEVTLRHSGEAVHLEVRDDGCGFDPQRCPPDGYGLAGMHRRAAELGGTLSVHSAPGTGCRIRVRLPVQERAR